MEFFINQDFKAIKIAIEDLQATDEGKNKLAFELESLLNRVSSVEEKVQVVITASESDESTKPKPKTTITMYPPVKNKLSDRRLVTTQEMDELYESTEFSYRSFNVVWHCCEGRKIPRFVEFYEQVKSKYFNNTYGVFKTPIAGRYRFKITGGQSVKDAPREEEEEDVKEAPEINAKTDWYLCSDEANDDNDNDHDDSDDDDSDHDDDDDDNDEAKQRRRIEFGDDEEYKVYKNETRKLLFSLDGDKRRVVYVGLECARRTHVWLECVKISGEFSDIRCGFDGGLVA